MAKFGPKPKSVEERFWPKVAVRGPDECWPWMARRLDSGYGRFGSGGLAHRASYEIANGPIPEGRYVIHSCDNPPCVNPAHLKLAEPVENTDDMLSKVRHRFGEAHPSSKLTSENVSEIRRLFDGGTPRLEIAGRFGISLRYVYTLGQKDKAWRLLRLDGEIVETHRNLKGGRKAPKITRTA